MPYNNLSTIRTHHYYINNMMNLFDRIVCNYSNLIALRQATQCKMCGVQLITNLEYANQCHTGMHCGNCVSQCKFCVQSGKRSSSVQSLLSDVRFKCSYEGNGCKDLVQYDQLQQHEASCKCRNIFSILDKNYTSFVPNSIQKTESRFSKHFTNIPFEHFSLPQKPQTQLSQESNPPFLQAILSRMPLLRLILCREKN
jgi:hypothetical protein